VDPASPERPVGGEAEEVDPRVDRALLAAHLAGDPQAFGVLFRRHRDRLWAVALRTTGDREEAADALQDAIVNAVRRADSYRGDAAVTTWLHRIVVNACLDRARRNTVRRTEPLPQEGTVERTATSEATPGPEQSAELGERRERVLAALRQVPAEQRAALVLVDMEGRPVAEAASMLGIPVGTVKSRCARGRARLATLLADLRDSAPEPVPDPPQGTGTRTSASYRRTGGESRE
jgi:RNA polymerase sigma-70 factor (ECF subfamily)